MNFFSSGEGNKSLLLVNKSSFRDLFYEFLRGDSNASRTENDELLVIVRGNDTDRVFLAERIRGFLNIGVCRLSFLSIYDGDAADFLNRASIFASLVSVENENYIRF